MELSKEYRTYQINIKKGHRMYAYFDGLCLNSTNLYNTTHFFIRQVYTSLNNDGALQPLQQEVMQTIIDNIDKMNVNQQNAYSKKLNKMTIIRCQVKSINRYLEMLYKTGIAFSQA